MNDRQGRPGRGGRAEPEGEFYGKYCGARENAHSGVHAAIRDKRIAGVTACSRDREEDCETGSRVARIVIEHYMKRPSLEDVAMRTIMEFANNGIRDMHDPGNISCCDAAMLFVLKDSYRFVISGNAHVYHFLDGRIADQSEHRDHTVLGLSPAYRPECSDIRKLEKGEHAFLLCSKSVPEVLNDEELEAVIAKSAGADECIKNLCQRMGEQRQFCASMICLPAGKKSSYEQRNRK